VTKRRVLLLFVGVLAAIVFAGPITAQTYPSRPLTLIVPYAAGGSADILPRRIAEHMQGSLGKPIVIENVPGAAGNIGTGKIARSAPDGHTFGLGTWSTHVANGAVYALQYDLVSDFEPISLIASGPLVIVGKKSLPVKDLKELISWLKVSPGAASQGTNGSGSVMHLAGVLFQKETGTQFQFVPYRGAAPAMVDLLGGHIDLYIGFPADILQPVRTGNLKAYAVASRSRLASAPDIPTVDEAGVPGLHVSGWFGLWAPKNTPHNLVGKLNASVIKALAESSVRRRLMDDLSLEIPASAQQTPEALAAYQKAEIQKWWPLIKAANIKAE
jgi:tripartite-type tricarboxylate transporter receptor subunit TctC